MTSIPITGALDPLRLRELVQTALAEDIGGGDVTVRTVLGDAAARPATARIIAKAPGVIAGLLLAELACKAVDPAITFEAKVSDGATVAPGDLVYVATGPGGALLTAERTALNFLGRLSGIATLARRFVDAVAGASPVGVRICDTRKTTPGLRLLEKYAAAAGGAQNHRIGLYDQVLIKENHLAAAGVTVFEAVQRARTGTAGRGVFIGTEAETLEQVEQGLAAGADMILLDEFSTDELRAAVKLRDAHAAASGKRVELEASGGITLATVRAAAEAGVDRISIGAITHSAPVLDLSCRFDFNTSAAT
ncbi:MAG: carboxylating nicotinate-nucleotide diphosphorylase [Planctomycetota bacterium]